MGKLGVMLVILVLGAVILSPLVMAFEPEPLPGDFSFAWNNRNYAVPVAWSLCASGALALFYSVMKR
jgi:hypothetical protein